MNFLITLSNLIIPFLLLYIISYGLMGETGGLSGLSHRCQGGAENGGCHLSYPYRSDDSSWSLTCLWISGIPGRLSRKLYRENRHPRRYHPLNPCKNVLFQRRLRPSPGHIPRTRNRIKDRPHGCHHTQLHRKYLLLHERLFRNYKSKENKIRTTRCPDCHSCRCGSSPINL